MSRRTSTQSSSTEELAEFAITTEFDEIPSDVRHHVKRLVIDSIGCGIGGAATHIGQASRRWAAEMCERDEATLIGQPARSSRYLAAYHNARAIGALDADEIFPGRRQVSHHGAVVVAATLAISEVLGLTGRQFLAAVATGYEVGSRLSIAMVPEEASAGHGRHGWGPGGVIGASLATSRLTGQDAKLAAHAIGLAGLHIDRAALQWTQVETAPLVKSADGGWQSMTGMMSASLASSGMTGYNRILDGPNGLWRALGYGACDFDALTSDLGTKWHTLNAAFKAWPCQYWMHPPLTAMSEIVSDNHIRASEIERILLRTNQRSNGPRFISKQPKSEVDLHFSLPHAAAMIVLGIEAGPMWADQRLAEDAKTIGLRERIDIELDPRASEFEDYVVDHVIRDMPASALVHTTKGTYEKEVRFGRGNPWTKESALSDLDLLRKYRAMSAGVTSDSRWTEKTEEGLAMLLDLENVENVRQVASLLSMSSGKGPE